MLKRHHWLVGDIGWCVNFFHVNLQGGLSWKWDSTLITRENVWSCVLNHGWVCVWKCGHWRWLLGGHWVCGFSVVLQAMLRHKGCSTEITLKRFSLHLHRRSELGRGNTIVCFEMTPRCVWTKICRVKLVIFVWLFSTVCFQMAVQMARLKWCKSHRSHFFSFSPLRFQMCPQNIYIRGRKVTLVAYVWVFSTVCLQMYPQITCLTRCKVTLVAFVWLSPLCFQMRDSFCVINLPSSGDE